MAEHDIMALNSLIATTIDSANGFEESARRAQSTSLSDQLADLARDRWSVVSTLQSEVTRLGGTPRQSGTAKAAAHRRWLDLRHAVATSDRAILKEIENGETYLNGKYEMLLRDGGLSEPVRRSVTEAFDSVRTGHDRARTLGQGFATGLPERTQVNWRNVGTGLGVAAAVGGVIYAANRSRRGMGYRSSGMPSSRAGRMEAQPYGAGRTAGANLGGSSARPMTTMSAGATATDTDRNSGAGAIGSATRTSRRGSTGATRLAASGSSDESLDRSPGSTGSTGGLGSESTGSMGTFGATGGGDLNRK